MRLITAIAFLLLTALAGAPVDAGAADASLADVAKDADWSRLRVLVERRVDVNSPRGDGSTGLHWVAHWDNLESASLLIQAGANVNAATDLGVTPLWLASENGSVGMVQLLLRAGANPNAALLSGETPVMVAARAGKAEVVEQLLAKGADVNVKKALRGRAQTALMWAVSQRHPDVVKVLLAHGADPHARSNTWTRIVKTTAEVTNDHYIIEMQEGGYTPLLFAARVGDLDSAKLLVNAGADPNDTAPYGTSATVVAAHSGHSDVAVFLLEKGADPNAAGAGYTALHAAILRGDERLVETLLSHGADPNARISRATPYRRDSIDFFIQPAFVGATPFWLAARYGRPKIMGVLAKGGADPLFVHHLQFWVDADREDRSGPTTALMAAAGMGDRLYNIPGEARLVFLNDPVEAEAVTLEAVTLAAQLGVDVNAADANGNTALHALCAQGYVSVVDSLIKKGAKLDAENRQGQSPLAAATAVLNRVRRSGDITAETDAGRRGRQLVSMLERTVALLKTLGATE